MSSDRAPIWPREADEIIASDQAVVFGYVTPARGVVLNPLTNFGLRDRQAGVVEPLSSSVGMWKKLKRIRRNPRVSVAYHTRRHGISARPEYVLVQGDAELTRTREWDWIERHRDAWERFAGPRDVGPWERWLEPYHRRVGTRIEVERVLVWPDLECRTSPDVYGAAWPGYAAPQAPPKNGCGPRVNLYRALRRIGSLENRLLSWVGADGYPVTVMVEPHEAEKAGIALRVPEIVPPGGRRAGLLAHDFARYTYGQHKRQYTGWLEVDGKRALYAPYTEHGYHLPWSRTAYRIGAGFVTRRGLRTARKSGFWAGAGGEP